MMSTVVDGSLSSIQQLFCSWEDQLATTLIQQNEKSTQKRRHMVWYFNVIYTPFSDL